MQVPGLCRRARCRGLDPGTSLFLHDSWDLSAPGATLPLTRTLPPHPGYSMELLKKLSEMPGAPGREELVRDFIIEQVKDHVDEMRVDAMGNLHCRKKAVGEDVQRVMIACHMDEIGFIVRHIDDKGFVRIQQLGGFDTRNLFARRVRIQTRDGKMIYGNLNPGGRPIHVASPEERNKIPRISDFYVDLGLSAEEAQGLIRVGDPVTLVQEFIELGGDLVSGKNMDNRAACWLGIRVLQNVTETPYDLHVVFTVQEEIGVRGATTASYQVQPDISIALDVTLAVDTPGVGPEDHITQLGKGCAIKIMDAGTVSDKDLVDTFIKLAEDNDITYQLEVLPLGATDNAAQQRSRAGSKAIALSVPTRYVHTVTETLHKQDLYATLALLEAYLKG